MKIHPELWPVRLMPNIHLGPLITRLFRRIPSPRQRPPKDVLIEDIVTPAQAGRPAVGLRVYTPAAAASPTPILVWFHGGGYLMGTPSQEDARCIRFVQELGITVVSPDYRLAPENPSPAALEDAYAALLWAAELARRADHAPARLAIGGASSGGGLAAALGLMVHDRGELAPAFQLLVYPMLDDRTALRDDEFTRSVPVWTAKSNRFAWASYLGQPPGGRDVLEYAAPARRRDLTGLPPTWIGVGDCDLFHDEGVAYARRLMESGVECELTVVEGGVHGFDALVPRAKVSRRFLATQVEALRKGMLGDLE